MLNSFNYAYVPTQKSAYADLLDNIARGYQDVMMPKITGERLKAADLNNQLAAIKAQYAGPQAEADLAKTGAQTGQANQAALLSAINAQYAGPKAQAYIGQAGAASRLSDAKIKAIQQKMMQASAGNNGDANQYSGDPNVVTSAPTKNSVTAMQKNQLATIGRNYIDTNFTMPYVGSGSNLQLANDRALVSNKNANPQQRAAAQERLLQAATSYKLLQEQLNYQINALGGKVTNQTLNDMRHSLLQGTPESLPAFVNNLPSDASQEVNRRFNAAQQEMSSIRSKYQNEGFPTDRNTGAPVIDVKSNIDRGGINNASAEDNQTVYVRDKQTGKVVQMTKSQYDKLVGSDNG